MVVASTKRLVSKVPEITLIFWVIKIIATTLGETAGDAASMSLDLGYALSSILFFAVFVALVCAQIKAKTYHRFLYWGVIVATTTVGTTMADFADRSLGIGYVGGSLALLICLCSALYAWKTTIGNISFNHITKPKVEIFYWLTILFSNTLGTALGDFFADTSDFGYGGSAVLFSAILVILVAVYYFTKMSRTFIFWAAFVLTRPLGAVLGDLLTKPIDHGGFDLSRIMSSVFLAGLMLTLLVLSPRPTGRNR